MRVRSSPCSQLITDYSALILCHCSKQCLRKCSAKCIQRILPKWCEGGCVCLFDFRKIRLRHLADSYPIPFAPRPGLTGEAAPFKHNNILTVFESTCG